MAELPKDGSFGEFGIFIWIGCLTIMCSLLPFLTIGANMEYKRLVARFLFFITFSFLAFSTPQYAECAGTYPDESLDLFGTIENPVVSSIAIKPHPTIFSFHDFYPKVPTFQHHQPRGTPSVLVLSVTLRC